MASLGYDTRRLKLVAFTLAGGFVGFAGALLAVLLQGAYPNNLNWQHAGDALLMVVLGGVHHALGPLWGAAAFILLEDWLSALLENWWLIFAPVIIVFALAAPEGLHGLARRLTGRTRWSLVRADVPPMPQRIAPLGDTRKRLDPAVPILRVRGLAKHFGSLHVAREIDLDVMPYQLHSLIGPNGAGKTTFFNMLSGLLPPDAGEVRFLGKDITRLPVHRRVRLGLGRSFQIVSVFANLTAFENVRVAVQANSPHRNALWRDAYGIDPLIDRAWSLLAAVGLQDRAAETCSSLSHGEQRLLEIAVTLATDAQVLLLDEPFEGLAPAIVAELTEALMKLRGRMAILLVEHHAETVLPIADRAYALVNGRIAFDGSSHELAADHALQARLLGVVQREPVEGAKTVAAL